MKSKIARVPAIHALEKMHRNTDSSKRKGAGKTRGDQRTGSTPFQLCSRVCMVVVECCRGGLKEVGATAYQVALVQGALYHSCPEGERRGGSTG